MRDGTRVPSGDQVVHLRIESQKVAGRTMKNFQFDWRVKMQDFGANAGTKKSKAGFRVDQLNPNLLTGGDVDRWVEVYDAASARPS